MQTITSYHQRTKHFFNKFAKASNHLDWKNQPNPYRHFDGAAKIELDVPVMTAHQQNYANLFAAPATTASSPMTIKSISHLLFYSLAKSSKKQYKTSTWYLRVNPSSGNLHPTEAYVLLPNDSSLYHYEVEKHLLERRCKFETEATTSIPNQHFLMALTSVHWRESWKYGERAFRYAQLDMGHAIAAVHHAARLLGWKVYILSNVVDADMEKLVGLSRAAEFATEKYERERFESMLLVVPHDANAQDALQANYLSMYNTDMAKWFGKANKLSPKGVDWNVIDDVSEACKVTTAAPLTIYPQEAQSPLVVPAHVYKSVTAEHVFRTRRSAQEFDKKAILSKDVFLQMMRKLLPTYYPSLWEPIYSTLYPQPNIHLALFVHRVVGLKPGMYAFIRNPAMVPIIKTEWHSSDREFVWQQVDPSLDLYLLVQGDAQEAAMQLSCTQEIAADCAFSFGMISQFEETLQKHGPIAYKHLHWEAGYLGHVMYLEAEAVEASTNLRATGMGCFFDDPVHSMFCSMDLTSMKWQSLYHFTVGGPLEDKRIVNIASPEELFDE